MSDLYDAQLLALAPESPQQAFTLSQDGDGISFVSTEVAWRVVGGLTAAQERVRKIADDLRTQPGPQAAEAREAFTALVDRLEVIDISGSSTTCSPRSTAIPRCPKRGARNSPT
ncbi:hypothetical protein [Streptomyces sp. NPDC058011]|uniref:hypothetical protein n=1 Tax=Streptomyces sp. NPDC058011 TaxID=3346305 RepID=UPI0036F0E70B